MSHTRKLSTDCSLRSSQHALRAHGCKHIFEDEALGRSLTGRLQLAKALDALHPGDCVVLGEWDSARSCTWDGLHIGRGRRCSNLLPPTVMAKHCGPVPTRPERSHRTSAHEIIACPRATPSSRRVSSAVLPRGL